MITHDSNYNKYYGDPGSGAMDAATLLVRQHTHTGQRTLFDAMYLFIGC